MKARFFLTYNRRNKLNNDGKASIEFQINIGGTQKWFSSKIYIEPKNWDNKRQQIKKLENADNLNLFLKQKLTELEKYEINKLNNNKLFSFSDAKAIIKEELTPDLSNSSNFISWIEVQLKQEKFEHETILSYEILIKRLKEFNSDLTFKNINYQTIDEFDNFIKKLKVKGHNKTVGVGTIHSYHKRLRRFINKAIKYKLLTENPYTNFKVKKPQVHKDSLTEEEIKRIEDLEGIEPHLEYVRDLFLFATYTAIRYSDIFSLTKDNIRETKEGLILHFLMQKPQKHIELPLFALFDGKAEKIIAKYNSKHTLFIYKANQDINRLLKIIKYMVNIDKNLTFHIARHTCLTIIGEKTGNPYLVMRIAGHSDIATSMQYTRNVYKKIDVNLLKW